jgi:hypothetical protein
MKKDRNANVNERQCRHQTVQKIKTKNHLNARLPVGAVARL